MAATVGDDTSWILELETALLEGCDQTTIRSITHCQPIPVGLRAEVWQICLSLGLQDISWDEIFDLPEQETMRRDCQLVVAKLGNEEEDKVSIMSDIESILTHYSKQQNVAYESENGWVEIVQPLVALRFSKVLMGESFTAIQKKYIPRQCWRGGGPFHLLRLLLLYHDPELCSFLDTQKISPDMYSLTWVNSLFSSTCSLAATHRLWDVYFQTDDPFLVFFKALVILVNAKEQILALKEVEKQTIADMIKSIPSGLEADDVQDFCTLAQYYSTKTPQSFKKEVWRSMFCDRNSPDPSLQLSQALCLPVNVEEIIQNTIRCHDLPPTDQVSFFLVDCRPAEQYNAGHLPTAFHLDCNLMLQEPQSFTTAVQALLSTQRQAIAAHSSAGGEHLCFLGSGREAEDQYVHMVVASFLQKHSQYVSIVRGGYQALHDLASDDLSTCLTDHDSRRCIACNPDAASQTSEGADSEEFNFLSKGNNLFGKFSETMKIKSAEVKGRLYDYITNPAATDAERHVSSKDRVGRRYRNLGPVFTIDDDHDGEEVGVAEDVNSQEVVSINTWLKKPDIIDHFTCQQVKENGYVYPSYLLITKTHLYILREMPERKGFAQITGRRLLTAVVKITSKKRHPEFITFKYGTSSDDGFTITDMDRFLIPKAGDATKLVKQQILHHTGT